MSPAKLTHPFHDIELELGDRGETLVKILSLDGRRFTYLVRAEWGPDAEDFVRLQIDQRMVGDLVIERTEDGRLSARESPETLKKHG